jgi:hypothetical protein
MAFSRKRFPTATTRIPLLSQRRGAFSSSEFARSTNLV